MLIGELAKSPGTRLHAAMTGSTWTLAERLLAAAIDVLAVANWQRQGKKGAPRPKPVSPDARPSDTEHAGDAGGRTQQEIDDLLDKWRAGELHRGG